MKKKDYINRFAELDNYYKYAWEDLHKDISDYILPRRGNFVDKGKPYESANVNRSDLILNDSATRANRILGSGMQGGLCSQARRWFKLTLDDYDLTLFTPVKSWLGIAENIMYKVYANSNFYTEIHRVFEEEGGFGTSVINQEEDFNTVVNFTVFSAGEYRLALGPTGKIDTCFRHYWMEAGNMVNMFGKSALSQGAQRAAEKNPHEYFEVIHAIKPRTNRNVLSNSNEEMPYESVWFELAGDTEQGVLRNSGYAEKSFAAPRWTPIGNSPYGLGPGCDCKGNVKMLQEMEKSIIKATHKEVDPPLAISSSFKDIISQLPGAVNYFEGADRSKVAGGPLLDIRYNVRNAEFKIEKIEARIERTFYNDIFTMIINAEASGRQITATEILERKEEKLVLLGPTVERQTQELFDPIIARTFNICLRRGLLPPPPQELAGRNINIKYMGVLAQAQRLSDAQNMRLYKDEAVQVQQLDPLTIVKTDWNEYLDQMGDILGLPQNVVRSKEAAEEMQAQMIQQQQEEEEAARAQQAVGMMKEMSRSETGGENVLTDLAGGA